MIPDIPLFAQEKAEDILSFIKDCEMRYFKPGEHICRQGEYDETCNIILEGAAHVLIKLEGTAAKKKIPLEPGQIFGEMAAFTGNPRTADIVASTPVTILNINKNMLFNMLDRFASVKAKLDQIYRERALSTLLLTIPIFAGVSQKILDELALKVMLHSYNTGDIIFRQGDDAEGLYLVRYGFVKVAEHGKDGQEKVLAYLKEGHYFGEMALLVAGGKRMATVSAINRVELIRIAREEFEELTKNHPAMLANIRKIVEKRKERSASIGKDELLKNKLSSVISSGIIQAKAILIMDVTKCVQCDNCVNACAALHGGKSRLARKGSMFNHFLLIPTSCRHCADPKCMSNCPTGAISRDLAGEIYHKDFCIGCGSCAKNCQYGNITLDVVSENDGENNGVSLLWRLRSRFVAKETGDNGAADPGAAKPERFVFPGDREMVQRPDEERLPGDRNMVASKPAAKKGKKAATRRKAVKCDMCRSYAIIGCVYHCPTGAARRVDPAEFFSDITSVG
jgi:CRP-like cAMP-binding protein/Fe-S-cluster-containing hydrogenase component 2